MKLNAISWQGPGSRAWTIIYLMAGLFWIGGVPLFAQEEAKKEEAKAPSPEKVIEDEFLKLGTEAGIGGKDWMKFERSQIKFQIEQFIPPLLQPAFVGDAFVLPPNAVRFEGSYRFARIDGGHDFFKDRDSNNRVFRNFDVDRNFWDFDAFYGFDLNRKYLHSFTLRLNVPYLNSRTNGSIHPNGIQAINVVNEGSAQAIGDVSLFLKKKIFDQATFPFGLAAAFGVHFPTGDNDKQFTNGGKVQARMPDMSGLFPGRNLLTNPITSNDLPLNMPIPLSMLGPPATMPFPASPNNVFDQFSPDGRLPAVLQPGNGDFGFTTGLFFTRQFLPEDFLFGAERVLPSSFRDLERFPGRSAFHTGVIHRFNREEDGIDPGDLTTFFLSYVKPFYRDYLSLDLGFVGFHQQRDKYKGTVIRPFMTTTPAGEPAIEFRRIKRPSFVKGTSGFITPSLIYSPDPQMRFALSGLFRVVKPELGPAPPWVVRFGVTFTF